MAVNFREANYHGFGKCLVIENGLAEIYVTIDIGPRIIRYALKDGKNLFFEDRAADIVEKGEAFDKHFYKDAFWRIYGGHRYWLSPEHMPLTYYPDNDQVDYKTEKNTATFVPKAQAENGVQLILQVTLDEKSTKVTVNHKLINVSQQEKEYSIWALSVFKKGGIAVVGQNKEQTGLLPNGVMALWPYTNMADKRVKWGEDIIAVKQNPKAATNFKYGIENRGGWGAFFVDDNLFVKKYTHIQGADYPDFGMSTEVFTNKHFIELESLSPMYKLAADAQVEHREDWELFGGVKAGFKLEELEAALKSKKVLK